MRSTDQPDAFNLQRFIQAQNPVFDRVQAELNAGHKRSHWMWFVFPQFAGLGGSEMSRRYAIRSREEAQAYLEHPLLGARLRTCTQEVLNIQQRSIAAIGEAKSGERITFAHLNHLEAVRAAFGSRAKGTKLLLVGTRFAENLAQAATRRRDVELVDLERLYFGS